MSAIEPSDEASVIDVLQKSSKPLVLMFLGNLTKTDGTPSASGKMKAVVQALADDSAVGGAQLLIKNFDAQGTVEQLYDVQSAPTTLLLQTKTIVGYYAQDWMEQAIKNAFHL